MNSVKPARIAILKLGPFSGKTWLAITSIKAENPAARVFEIKMDSHLGKRDDRSEVLVKWHNC